VSPTSATAIADDLVANGQFREAIDALTAANRGQRDPHVEARLVELRRDAPRAAARADVRQPGPPRLRDPFRRVEGVPEVTLDRLTIKRLRSAIFRHGSLLVRGLFDDAAVARLVDDIDRSFDAYDAHVAGTPLSDTAPWFVPFEPRGGGESVPREFIRDGGGVVAVDSPRALFDVIEEFDSVGLRELITQFFGEPPLLLANKWTLRRVEPGGDPDWHQDGAFLGPDIRSLDVWVSLSHCGVDAPGLDVVARRLPGIVEVGTNGANFDWSVGPGTIETLAPEGVVRPEFRPGDALIFDHLLLHRTAVHPDMHKRRYAIEAWFTAPSAYPPGGLPILY
jgi:hypothetical protein